MRPPIRQYKVLPSAVYVGDKRFVRGDCVGRPEVGLALRRLIAAGVLQAIKPEVKASLQPNG